MEVKGLLRVCEVEVMDLFRSCEMEVMDLPCSHDVEMKECGGVGCEGKSWLELG